MKSEKQSPRDSHRSNRRRKLTWTPTSHDVTPQLNTSGVVSRDSARPIKTEAQRRIMILIKEYVCTTELKDDRMENSINGSRYRHILRYCGGCARRYGPGPPSPHSPPLLPAATPYPTPTQSAVCCTNSCLLKHYFAVQQCYFEMKPI